MRALLTLLVLLFGVACWALLKSAGLDTDDAIYYAAAAAFGITVACFGVALGHAS